MWKDLGTPHTIHTQQYVPLSLIAYSESLISAIMLSACKVLGWIFFAIIGADVTSRGFWEYMTFSRLLLLVSREGGMIMLLSKRSGTWYLYSPETASLNIWISPWVNAWMGSGEICSKYALVIQESNCRDLENTILIWKYSHAPLSLAPPTPYRHFFPPGTISSGDIYHFAFSHFGHLSCLHFFPLQRSPSSQDTVLAC
jgi:hypothetical protein